jgi:ABC-type multidrug transport system ATPase subunit
MSKTMLLLEIENLTVELQGKSVITHFSLEVRSGEKVSLSGPSGSGKSTLMNCILGFVRPQKGIIRILGEILDQSNVWTLRRQIGFVPQEPQLGNGTVSDMLVRPFRYHSNRELAVDEAMKEDLFDIFQMEPFILKKNIRDLSGGEKQRVALISSLLLKRSLYLLDEITSALDDINSHKVIDYLLRRQDLAIIFSSHDQRILESSTRIIPLNHPGNKGK